MVTKNIKKIKGNGLENVSLGYPLIAVHQLYVHILEENPKDGPRDAVFIPEWLYKKAGLKYGEKIVLTRENCQSRHVKAERNRTVTAVFPWSNDYAAAVGPTAKFLGEKGQSCFIAYAHGSLEEITTMDLSFPFKNTANKPKDLTIRSEIGQKKSTEISDNVYETLAQAEREVLVTSISGLVVEVGDPYCNPKLAQIPIEIMKKAGLPTASIEAYFANGSKPIPALKSYVVPSQDSQVTMSGALFGAFPVGSEFVINIYGRVMCDTKVTPTLVYVNNKA